MMKRTRVIDTQRAVSELQDLATYEAQLDHRQTISVSPVSSPRAAVNSKQQLQPPPANAKSHSSSKATSSSTTPSKESCGSVAAARSSAVIGPAASAASAGHRKMKYSSPSPPSSRRASSSSSPSPSPLLLSSKKQQQQPPQRHHKRPPRSKHNRPKSVVSDATNSTYLSSDSEEDTIRSGGDGSSCAAFSGASSSNHSGASTQGSSGGGAAAATAVGIATRKSQLRHPHNTNGPPRSYAPETSPRSMYCHPPHPAPGSSPSSFGPRRGSPETNKSRFHLPQTKIASNTAAATAAGEISPPDSPIGIGDDVADFLLQYSDNEDDPQQMLYLTAPSSVPMPLLADQAFEATQTAGTTYAILPLETSSSSSSDEDDAFLQLIQESSTRWRQTVEQTVNETVHTNLMVGYSNNNNINTSSSPIHNPTTAIPTFDHQHHLVHPQLLLAPPSTSAALINKKAVIEEQQAEIEALRAQLEQQRIDTAPVTQIEVVVANHHHNNSCYGPTTMVVDMVTDDLTMVSSDFAPIVPPKTLKRPDAASVVSKPPTPKSTTRAFSMLMGGQPVKAVFTGNLTHDIDGDYCGVGMIRFSNGNVYRGEMRHSQLHGKGSLHCPLTNETFTGQFENGQYAGP